MKNVLLNEKNEVIILCETLGMRRYFICSKLSLSMPTTRIIL